MTNQETILSPIINGVQTIAERFIQIAKYDKTVAAEILFQDSENINDYYVSTSGYARLKVHTLEQDETKYRTGDNVYINVPEGNFNSDDKVIIGKIRSTEKAYYLADLREILAIQDRDLDENRNNSDPVITNDERFTTLVVEFEPRVELYYKGKLIKSNDEILNSLPIKLKMENIALSIDLHYGENAEDRKNHAFYNIWNTRSLYGNIFDTTLSMPHFQRIIFSDIQNLRNPSIWWSSQQEPVSVLTFADQPIQDLTAKVIIENKKYYYGYTAADLEKISLHDVALRATETGYFLFMRKGFFDSTLSQEEQREWDPRPLSLKDLPRDYNWRVELRNKSEVAQHSLSDYLFKFNGMLTEEELGLDKMRNELNKVELIPHIYVPENYLLDKVEITSFKISEMYEKYLEEINASINYNDQNDKLVCLIAWPLWETETSNNRQVIYDIIERKEQENG